jgi:hypothetical protein
VYGDGYSIVGAAHLEDHGIASVQLLSEDKAIALFGAIREATGHTSSEHDGDRVPGIDGPGRL